MEESVDDATDAGRCARVTIEAKLFSGELIAKVDVVSSMTGNELQAKLEQHVGEGKRIQGILFKSTVVGSRTLSDVGISGADTAHIVNVVIGARPTLYMFNPCSAAELAQRLVNLNDFGDVSDIPVFKEAIQFGPMDQAPSGSKEIAGGLQSVLQSSLGKMFPSAFGGFFDGHVVVLTGINTESDAQVKQTFCEALGGINTMAYAKTLTDDPDEQDILEAEQDILEVITFHEEDWSNPDECPFANDCYALEDPGIDEEAMSSAKAAQKIMVNKLKKHFIFEFDWDIFKLFPQIHGGFDSDGNVIGILRGRLVEA
mmetsp:Transcript_86638/g.245678  ORF Transcript_86638/g.245678 Transcript_86638/m.245678 type:complete len:314 (-) Transcript_86638:141-1082(-)